MSSLSEREMRKKIDEEILSASPELLEKIQKFDLENQLNFSTIYEIYSTIINSEKKYPQNQNQDKIFGLNEGF